MANYRDSGVVLRAIRLGEADRIVTLLTEEHGKVRAVAKGVRKLKSRIGARLEVLTHVDVLCWRGRELDVVSQVEVVDVFRKLRANLALLGPAMTMAEIADQVTVDHQQAPELYTLLVGALRTLETTGAPIILSAFCLKLLALEGVGLTTDRCARCGEDHELVAFDASEGGFLCQGCRSGRPVNPAIVAIARQIGSGGLARALDEQSSPAIDGLELLMTGAIERHLDRRLRTTRYHYLEAGQPA